MSKKRGNKGQHQTRAKPTVNGQLPDWTGHGRIALQNGYSLLRVLMHLFHPVQSIRWDSHQGCYILPHPNYHGLGQGYLFFYPDGYWCAVEVKSEDVQ